VIEVAYQQSSIAGMQLFCALFYFKYTIYRFLFDVRKVGRDWHKNVIF